MSVRVRFAPSPTGPLHIGGVRTALFNALFARNHGGSFILRIEDTDQVRYIADAERYIIKSLEWLGLQPDESPDRGGPYAPYLQSERREIYRSHAHQLIKSGHAYYAFDTPEELDTMRQRLEASGIAAPKYDAAVRHQMRNSLVLTAEETQGLLDDGTPCTIRLHIPDNADGEVSFADLIRGEVSFHLSELDDRVLLKADGMPTYHLANVVDDHLMKITHVIRGEEWLSSTAHHVLLYRAFGWADRMPKFAHLPLILKPSGQGKLSKRDGKEFGFPVFPLEWKEPGGELFPGFREMGFLPDAMINFLALLGWNPGTEQEIFDRQGLIDAFSLEHVSKGGARFDFDKALWFNQQYILAMTPEGLADLAAPMFVDKGYSVSADRLLQICTLYRERIRLLPEIIEATAYLFKAPEQFDQNAIVKFWTPDVEAQFAELTKRISDTEPFEAGMLREVITTFIKERGLKMGAVLQLLRTAISGSPSGPDVFLMLELTGRDDVAVRLQHGPEAFRAMLK